MQRKNTHIFIKDDNMRLEGKSLKSDFFRFIIPSIAAQWVFSLYTMVDGIFVARGVSETALTAVNISMPFSVGMFSISLLFAVGNSTIVAIRLGQGKSKEANEIFTQNVVLLIILSVLITVSVLVFLDPFARFLGATDANISYVKEYIRTIAPFAFAYLLSYSFETLIKTDGYPKLAITFVTIGALLNCLLDYIMIFILDKGVFGAAFATGISQSMVIVFYLVHFLGKNATIRFSKFKVRFKTILRQMRNGLSSGITEFSSGIIIFFFNHAIITFINEDALVSYTIVSYINTLVIMALTGIAQGTQPLISYYLGKGEPAKYRKLFKYSIIAGIVFAAISTLLCYVLAGSIVSLFLKDMESDLAVYSVRVFRIFILSFLVAIFNVIISGYFTSVEKAGFATAISLSRSIIALIGSLFVLTALFGGEGIWWSPLLAESVSLVMTLIMLKIYLKNEKLYAIKYK